MTLVVLTVRLYTLALRLESSHFGKFGWLENRQHSHSYTRIGQIGTRLHGAVTAILTALLGIVANTIAHFGWKHTRYLWQIVNGKYNWLERTPRIVTTGNKTRSLKAA